jgi:hypothetical protein
MDSMYGLMFNRANGGVPQESKLATYMVIIDLNFLVFTNFSILRVTHPVLKYLTKAWPPLVWTIYPTKR